MSCGKNNLPEFIEVKQITGERNIIATCCIERVKENLDGAVSLMVDGEWIGVVERLADYWWLLKPIDVCSVCEPAPDVLPTL